MWKRLEQALWTGGLSGWLASICLRLKGWKLSSIPDQEVLWRALFKRDHVYADGSIKPSYFRDRRGGYSCDLARLSSREKSRRGYKPPPWPDEAGLVAFKAEHVRAAGSDINHSPLPGPHPNYSHCEFAVELSAEGEASMASSAWFEVAQRVRPVKGGT